MDERAVPRIDAADQQSPPSRVCQFSTRELLAVFVMVAAIVTVARLVLAIDDGWYSPQLLMALAAFAVGLFLLAILTHGSRKRLVICAVTSVTVAFILPARRSNDTFTLFCANNMRTVGIALQAYLETHGHFPPSIIRDAAGRPLYSWRVELLPFLEQPGLYERFHRDEPWDSPHNKSLLKEYSLFHCPADGGPLEMTSYVAIVGEHGILQRDRPTTIEECTDGLGNTIMLVECSGSGIAWSEPRDLEFDTLPMQINAPHQCGIRSNHIGGVNIVFANMHVMFLGEAMDPDLLRSMLTRNGAERVSTYYGEW